MRRFENIKQIDLTDRDHPSNRSEAKNVARLQSHSRSSKRSYSRDQCEYFDCFTERSRSGKIN